MKGLTFPPPILRIVLRVVGGGGGGYENANYPLMDSEMMSLLMVRSG